MAVNKLFTAGAISSTGMSAERLRMEVIANNIANANSTKSANGGTFRRQEVVFAAVMDRFAGKEHPTSSGLQGVEVVEIVEDQSELPKLYMPAHPDADTNGYVTMPNVSLPVEMVNLMTASRAYEANVKAAQTFRQLGDQALAILRS
ncbi:flagellar basal body rod protein FlgC [Zavarzinella formosa]|uniref:flagellar basal body rod protein FlgC n=1 Tax=Zavarzinella formosa TaxID=360055 RepID=UPI00030A2D12|nr:flagellar basal body rod protein FlgC [Zavarzinella formosa]